MEKDGPGEAVPLAKLRELQGRLIRLEAKLEAGAPTLELLEGSAAVLDGEPMECGRAKSVTQETVLEVGDARLLLRVPEKEGVAEEREEVLASFSALLSACGAASIEEAAEKEAQRLALQARKQELRSAIALLAPQGLVALRAEVAEDEAAGGMELQAPSVPEEKLTAEEQKVHHQRLQLAGRLKALTGTLDELEDARRETEIEVRSLSAQIAALTEQLGDADTAQAALASEAEKAAEAVLLHQRRLDDAERALRAVRSAETRLARLQQAAETAKRRREELLTDISGTATLLQDRQGEGVEEQLAAAEGELERAEQLRSDLERRRGALKLLLDLLSEEAESRRRQVTGPVMRELLPMTEQLFGAGELRFDTEWNPETFERPGGALRIAQLSAGTREQLGILTRLAFARLLAKQGTPVPVILDDALTYSDDQRASRFFDILHEAAAETQIIVLTCHERLFQQLGGHRLTPRPYTSLTER
jgi:DNA repair exonuclease SbcCD ATPase subunit